MKSIFATLALTLAFSVSALCQNTDVCPTIRVLAPTPIILAGEIMNFSVGFENNVEASNLKFVWTVSVGTIIEGQNTPTIKVITTSDTQGITVTAKVEIQGLPEGCNNQALQVIDIVSPPVCRCTVDEYEKIPWREEMARLENFAIEILSAPEYRAFILLSVKKEENARQVRRHIRKMARFLESCKVKKERLIFAIESSEYHTTKFYIVADGVKYPSCEDCKFINGKSLK